MHLFHSPNSETFLYNSLPTGGFLPCGCTALEFLFFWYPPKLWLPLASSISKLGYP